MTMGFPMIHNVSRFKSYGYYYEENDFDAAAERIVEIVENHGKNKEMYAAHTMQLTWQFSIYNPTNSMGWKKLLGSM